MFSRFIILLVGLALFSSCKKESFTHDRNAKISFSVDSLFFDTVFTTAGSVTKSFKIFNPNDGKINIGEIKLMGANTSPFKMNVDGISGSDIRDVAINANDSAYVFIQVNINPSAITNPFLMEDTIQILCNGNISKIGLSAYGRNAVFLKNHKVSNVETWINTLPYVILGGLQIDTNAVLNIPAGTEIYVHADAPILVDGTLKALGTANARVHFSGDRMDEDYRDLPASWPGIFFRSTSKNNELRYVHLKNAYQGIIAQDLAPNGQPKVLISRSMIDNIYDAGILAIHSSIQADNSLISNCGSNVVLALGGNYQFINCTVASYGSRYINRSNPVLQVADYLTQDQTTLTAPLNALFQNSIFWGESGGVENEVLTGKKGTSTFSVIFDHVIYKAKTDPSWVTFISSLKNANPNFDKIDLSKGIFDFHTTLQNSPAVKAGTLTGYNIDLDGKTRVSPPDIGCYEK